MQKLKQIKFNLLVDNVPVRSLAELRENFNISDIHEYFLSGQLVNWLTSRNCIAEAQSVAAIDKNTSLEEYLPKLLNVLGCDSAASQDAVQLFIFETQERVKQKKLILDQQEKIGETLAKGIQCYQDCCQRIIELQDDFSQVKAAVNTLLNHYGSLFQMDYMHFFEIMQEKCPLAIFAVLMNEKYRNYFLVKKDQESGSSLTAAFHKEVVEFAKAKLVYSQQGKLDLQVGDMIVERDHPWYQKGYLKIIGGPENNTEGQWDRVTNKKVMIIYSLNASLQIWQNYDKDLIYQGTDDEERFPIFDTLEQRTNTDKSIILYMEI